MRYIGNKENILDKIHSILIEHGVSGNSFFDFFREQLMLLGITRNLAIKYIVQM